MNLHSTDLLLSSYSGILYIFAKDEGDLRYIMTINSCILGRAGAMKSVPMTEAEVRFHVTDPITRDIEMYRLCSCS